MKQRKQHGRLGADDVFGESSTNAFLVALESWIARKLPAPPPVGDEQLEQTLAELDRLTKLAGNPGSDADLILRQMARAVTPIFPAAPAASSGEPTLNRHERLFRAVFFFAAESYDDGVESYLTAHDAADLRSAIEGLGELGAGELQARLASLCQGLFGEDCPATPEARGAVVDAAGPAEAALLDELGRFFAKRSVELDEALTAWARANRQHFV